MMRLPKNKPIRNKSYLARVRLLPCVVCQRPLRFGESVRAHHAISGGRVKGMGTKSSDDETIPLCDTHHRLLHHDFITWEKNHGTQDYWIAETQKELDYTRE